MNDLQLDDFKTDENAAMVLLVDDQAMIGEAVRRGLAHEDNIDFHFCADPHQAIAQAIRIKPTVILQDLVMPGLDGLTLVREYRNHPATQAFGRNQANFRWLIVGQGGRGDGLLDAATRDGEGHSDQYRSERYAHSGLHVINSGWMIALLSLLIS